MLGELLLCNDWHTQAVLQYVRAGQELHSISNMEQMLQIGDQEDRDVLDALATQYSAAGLQPLQVFTRSVQCGVMPACRAAESRGEAAVLARHQQVAELHRQMDKHRLTAAWVRSNVDLLVRQGIDEAMAELIMLALVLLAEHLQAELVAVTHRHSVEGKFGLCRAGPSLARWVNLLHSSVQACRTGSTHHLSNDATNVQFPAYT